MYCVAVGVLNYTVCMYQAVHMCLFCFILIFYVALVKHTPVQHIRILYAAIFISA